MKRKIICYILLISVVVNLFPTYATRGRNTILSPKTTHSPSSEKKRARKRHSRSSLAVPTCQEILASSYCQVVFEKLRASQKTLSHKNQIFKKAQKRLSEPGNVALLGSYMPQKALMQMAQASSQPISPESIPEIEMSYEANNTPEDESDMLSDTKLPTESDDESHEKSQIDSEPLDTSKIRNVYRHDAYTSLDKFADRWDEFIEYFEKLVASTHFIKYFGPDSQLSTQSINETIREFMTPSEYLNEVERIFLSEDTFNSQIVSEIISKKLSELGFENYILQLIPGDFEHSGAPASINQGRWVVLYRGGLNNWYVVDFSLAMEHKFDASLPPTQATTIPFSRYMEKLLNLASNQDEEWFVKLGTQTLRNVVMINFTPGFYERSDDYYMADISYIPFDYFVSVKLKIEQEEGLNQYITDIKPWMEKIRSKPNYRILEQSPETIREMSDYMMNFLVFTE